MEIDEVKKYQKYILKPYSGSKSRCKCPKCGDKHSFTYYINAETGIALNSEVGRCNHENSCGYHKSPMHLFSESFISSSKFGCTVIKGLEQYSQDAPAPKPISFINEKHLIETESNFHKNNFVQFLLSIYDYEIVVKVIDMYRIGTSNHWKGATIFWYLDELKRIRSGKVMQYDALTGELIKTKDIPHLDSMRSILLKKGLIDSDFNQVSGLFGEHLLINKDKSVCIVESEKTAIIASINFPENIWLASGKRSFLTEERVNILKGRDVTLYPDYDAYELWSEKANKYRFKISNILMENRRKQDANLADFILKHFVEDDCPF